MKKTLIASLTAAACITQATAVNLQDLLPMQEGYTVVTCSSGGGNMNTNPNGPVVGLINTSTGELTAAGTGGGSASHNWEMFHNELALQNPNAPTATEEWVNRNLGEVFGVTLDDQNPPNIYVTAATVYQEYTLGPLTWPAGETAGSVYRLDGTTGEITTCVQLPNSTPALGNITFHRSTDQSGWLYVSNFDDGKIYRISENCQIASNWDHGSTIGLNDDPTTDWTQLGRRVWGLEVHQDRLYYGVWNATTAPQEIWSVALAPNGDFVANSELLEVTVPAQGNIGNSSLPVSDIEFTDAGVMVFAERYHQFWPGTYWQAHRGRVLEYVGSTGAWVASPTSKFLVGSYGINQNSAGGVALDCEGSVWASGDALSLGAPTAFGSVYGLQWIPSVGNTTDIPEFLNGYLIDYNGVPGTLDKSQIGEVELFDNGKCSCLDIAVRDIECPPNEGDLFLVDIDLTNTGDYTGEYWFLTPCPAADLPAGSITLQPDPSSTQTFPAPFNPGDTTGINVNFPGSLAGETVCFLITILNRTGEECCTEKICIEFPDCNCFTVVDKSIECEVQADGTVKYVMTVTLTNNAPWAIEHITLLPPAAFSPDRFDAADFGGPIAPGATGSFTTCVAGNEGDEICFNIVAHSEGLVECCSEECCITLPPCEGMQDPDKCFVTERAPCCPPQNAATVTISICNNSAVAKSYSWNIASIAGGTVILPGGVYAPGSGNTGPVAPGNCWTGTITVFCEGMEPGQTANYQVCFREDLVPGAIICCRGQVYVPQPGQIVIKENDPDPDDIAQLNPGDRVQLSFEVSNPGQERIIAPVVIRDRLGALRFSHEGAGGEGESALVTMVQLDGGQAMTLNFEATLDRNMNFDSPQLLPVLLSSDQGLLTTTVVLLTVPQAAAFTASISQISCVEVGIDRMMMRIDLRVSEGAELRIESAGDLQNWETVNFTTNSDESAIKGSVISNGDLMTVFLPIDETRSYFRAIAGTPGITE